MSPANIISIPMLNTILWAAVTIGLRHLLRAEKFGRIETIPFEISTVKL
jgi:hypothetical protein